MSIAFIALGSNLGNREDYIKKAIALMEEEGMLLLKSSKIIETDPIGGPAQGKYLNSVIKIKTDLDPHHLLKSLLLIEQKLGRKRLEKNGPRTIDLDILLYDHIKINSETLTIPHPRMGERPFVREPLLSIEPGILKNENI